MAAPSSADIAKLVGEIRDLKNALDESSLDVALKGLLNAAGEFDSAAWAKLSPDEQTARGVALDRLKQILENAVAAGEPVVRIPRNSFMYKKEASNGAILLLTAMAFFGLFGDLALICHEWEAATAGTRGILEFTTPSVSTAGAKAQETGAVSLPSPSPKERAALKPNPTPAPALSALSTPSSPTPEAAGAVVSPADATLATRSAVTGSPLVSPSPEKKEEKATTPGRPTEQAVLWMVILMGALGGFLHLASSMAKYVGERELLRSWIIYYILSPFQGAALALLIFLLLQVGVLNPAANTTASGHPTESLNLIGIYAFAALTGLFSKQAIEMMADVFSTIFKKVSTKDSLEKPKSDAAPRK